MNVENDMYNCIEFVAVMLSRLIHNLPERLISPQNSTITHCVLIKPYSVLNPSPNGYRQWLFLPNTKQLPEPVPGSLTRPVLLSGSILINFELTEVKDLHKTLLSPWVKFCLFRAFQILVHKYRKCLFSVLTYYLKWLYQFFVKIQQKVFNAPVFEVWIWCFVFSVQGPISRKIFPL